MNSTKAGPSASRIAIEPHGFISGQEISDAATGQPLCNRYLGVPYAQPPIGPRRWALPQPLPAGFSYSSQSCYDSFAPQCLQPKYRHQYSIDPPEPPRESEDCLYLNIWTPCGDPPEGGWPIWFQIHGGWLQTGDANQSPLKDLAHLIAPRDRAGMGLQCVVVFPAYRLNVFGFLGSDALDKEAGKGNFGFFDQRLALEWVHSHARSLGGNPSSITVSGLSAGAQSAHAQVLYEFSRAQQDESYRPLIRRCLLRSGTAMLPPKSFEETRPQLEELARCLDIEAHTDSERLQAMRAVPAKELVAAIDKLKMHTFRSVDDGGPAEGGFVSSSWAEDMRSGAFSRWCKKQGVTFMIGECANEDQLYRLINPPNPTPSFGESLQLELHNYYPLRSTEALLRAYADALPANTNKDGDAWATTFGRITSDAQVFAAERLLIRYLIRPDEGGLTQDDVLHYRLERRAGFLDEVMPRETGVYHGACEAVFLYMKEAILAQEQVGEAAAKTTARKDLSSFEEFCAPFLEWVRGRDQASVAKQWLTGSTGDTESVRTTAAGGASGRMRILRADGRVEVARDPLEESKDPLISALEKAIFA